MQVHDIADIELLYGCPSLKSVRSMWWLSAPEQSFLDRDQCLHGLMGLLGLKVTDLPMLAAL